jgi:hypothetical protein
VRLVDDSNVKIDMDIHIGAEFPYVYFSSFFNMDDRCNCGYDLSCIMMVEFRTSSI